MIGKGAIKVFNEAAEFASTGNPGKAFELYTSLVGLEFNQDQSVPEIFPALVELRRACCLTDLGRLREARQIIEAPLMKASVGKFEPLFLYEFHFIYGTILGRLGNLETMVKHLKAALQVAAEQIGDLQSCENCWYYMMTWAKKHEQWKILEERCVSAHIFGRENGSPWLQGIALEFGCYAYRGLGKSLKAKQGAEVVLRRLRSAEVDEHLISGWERFLATVA